MSGDQAFTSALFGIPVVEHRGVDDGTFYQTKAPGRESDCIVVGTARPWRVEARNIVRMEMARLAPWIKDLPRVDVTSEMFFAALTELDHRDVAFLDGPLAGQVRKVQPEAWDVNVALPRSIDWNSPIDLDQPVFDTVQYEVRRWAQTQPVSWWTRIAKVDWS